mmetsp:Transcript_87545/g.160358  ORF Transcript_87545/g.160358 Transcript_87545/m.160358 type:complete len:87 (-) Transcript_87545:1728-1988(-)
MVFNAPTCNCSVCTLKKVEFSFLACCHCTLSSRHSAKLLTFWVHNLRVHSTKIKRITFNLQSSTSTAAPNDGRTIADLKMLPYDAN